MARKRSFLRTIGDLWSSGWSTIGGFFGIGGYSATDPRRKILPYGMRPSSATANELLTASLPGLRSYCRHLERNNPIARAAIEGWLAEIVGTGIALEPDTGSETTDKRIRAAWNEYIRDCSMNGHDLYYLQGQALREVATSGEMLWRLAVLPERIEAGKIPLVVLPLESEWLDDTAQSNGQPDAEGITWIGGVGIDKYGRPVRYRMRAPGFGTVGAEEIIPAREIIHEFERRRSLQARGEPWFAPVIEKLQQMQDLVDAELKAAVNCSAMAMVITAEAHDALDTTVDGASATDPAQSIRLGGVARMYPGEKVEAFSHTRPSQQIAPFLRMMLGEIAGALRISQRWLDRAYDRANYSSMRGDNQDSNRLLAPVREWLGHATAGRLYREVLPYISMKAGVPMPRPNYRLLPDEQAYVDPVKDVLGDDNAIKAKFTTREAIVGKRGGDYRQVQEQLEREAEADDAALIQRIAAINVSIENAKKTDPTLELTWAQVITAGGAATAPGAYLDAIAAYNSNANADSSEPAPADQPAEAERAAPPQTLNFNIAVENQNGKSAPVKRAYSIKRAANGQIEHVERI